MKLDEKYFIPFLAILAVVSALLIVFFTVNSREGREQAFRKKMARQDSLRFASFPVIGSQDSLGVHSYPNSYVVIDFWATWTSSFSEGAHRQLARLKKQHPERLEVIAAVVEDKRQRVQQYIDRYRYPFHYVNGTRVFNHFGVPGVPTQLVYRPGGTLHSIFSGYADSTRLDSLQTILSNE